MANWRNPFRDTKPTTVGLFLLVCLWALFQWKDPTPPPVLDQILVASFGVWFANEAIDKKNEEVKAAKKKKRAVEDEGTDDEEEDTG